MISLLHVALTMAIVAPGPTIVNTPVLTRLNPAQGHYRARITIKTDALGNEQEADEVSRQQELFDRDIPPLFGAQLKLTEEPADNTADILITVGWRDFADFRYGVTIAVTTPDGRSNETSFDFQGDEHDLIERLDDEVATVAAWLERPAPEPATEPTAPPHPTTPTPAPSSPTEEPRLHALGKTGIGVAAVGLVAGVTGSVLFTLTEPATTLDNGNRDSAEQRRFPVPSIALMVAGGAALATGVALLVADLSKSKKSHSQTSLRPALSTHGGGLSLSGRF